MQTANWIYDVILYVYALSLLFYFSDFIKANRRAKQIGTGLLIFVWMLHTGHLALRIFSQFGLLGITQTPYWLFFSWLLLTVSLIINRFLSINFIVFFMNAVSFSVLVLQLHAGENGERAIDAWQTSKELLFVHIGLVLCAYAVLTIGTLLSGMYLFLHHRLKNKRWSAIVRRFPSLDIIEQYVDKAIVIGVPLLAMSLAIAVTSLLVEGRPILLLDWKVLTSFTALTMYIIYVYQRTVKERLGTQLAKLNIVSFVFLLLNIWTSSFSGFH